MSKLRNWATKWGISALAIADLEIELGMLGSVAVGESMGMSESEIQQRYRLEASKRGELLWRNNVGVLKNEQGVPVRYGLCNDSSALNKIFKSGDLIGMVPTLITPDHVGMKLAIFKVRECKPEGWTFKATDRETAQLNFINLVLANGGDAAFATGPDW